MRWHTRRAARPLALALGFGACLACGRAAPAALIGSADNASNPAYSAGWTSGTNGGVGFEPWTLTPQTNTNNAGFFIGNSYNNGDGGGNAPPNTDIDVAGKSWGLYANGGQSAEALRPLTSALVPGRDDLRLRFDNGWIDTGGTVGVAFLAGGEERARLTFVGGEQNYAVQDPSGSHDTGVAFTDEGLFVEYFEPVPNVYWLTIQPAGGTFQTTRGTYTGTSGVDTLRFFNTNAGPGSQHDVFVNSLSVLPEPGSLGLLTIVTAGLLRRRRR